MLYPQVIATHPFHTMFFEPFHKLYPNAPYYGTPRHLRRITSLPWAGSVTDEGFLRRWESEGIFMRIPEGAEFVNPEENNHFCGLFVYHQPSKTIFIDDTVNYIENPGFILRFIAGLTPGSMSFWPLDKGLRPTKEAPMQFSSFVEGILKDWDFENICTAHNATKLGGAKVMLSQTLERARPKLEKIAQSHSV